MFDSIVFKLKKKIKSFLFFISTNILQLLMFGFQKYLDQIYQIKWYFDAKDLEDIEHMLYVKFKSETDYFLIDRILYTYVDILLGLVLRIGFNQSLLINTLIRIQ